MVCVIILHMTENTKPHKPFFRWLWPEFSLTVPGDFALGFLLAAQAAPADNFTPASVITAAITGILLIIALFCLYKANSAHSRLTGYATGIYRLLAVSFCAAVVYRKGIPPQAMLAGLALALYSAATIRVGLERFNEPTQKLGFAGWWPSVLAGALGMVCITRNMMIFGLTGPTLAAFYIGAWLLFRNIYVSNAIKGWCSPERLFQASGLFIRGTIQVQAVLFMTFPTEKSWNIVAAAFVAIALSTLQTVACKVLPTPED